MSERRKFSGKNQKRDDQGGNKSFDKGGRSTNRSTDRRKSEDGERVERSGNKKSFGKKPYKGPYKKKNPSFQKSRHDDGSTRLNKYLANSGISSRREADELITSGLVEVNGKVIVEMGYRVQKGDEVKYAGEKVIAEKPVYILLNKPKDYSTSMKATTQRTAFSLLKGISNPRVVPIGKMDINTTGLIIFTNDGDLTKKLSQQRSAAKHIYHIHLDKNIKKEHLDNLTEGIDMDGMNVRVNEVSYVAEGKDKKQIGLEIQNGKNGIVRALLEHLGYNVIKLDRVVYAGLTKKDLPRGKWRQITENELVNLKMLK